MADQPDAIDQAVADLEKLIGDENASSDEIKRAISALANALEKIAANHTKAAAS